MKIKKSHIKFIKQSTLNEVVRMDRSARFSPIDVGQCNINIPPVFKEVFLSNIPETAQLDMLSKLMQVERAVVERAFTREVLADINTYINKTLDLFGMPTVYCVLIQKGLDVFEAVMTTLLGYDKGYTPETAQPGSSTADELDIVIVYPSILERINEMIYREGYASDETLRRLELTTKKSFNDKIQNIYLIYVLPNMLRNLTTSGFDVEALGDDIDNFKEKITKARRHSIKKIPFNDYRDVLDTFDLGRFSQNKVKKEIAKAETTGKYKSDKKKLSEKIKEKMISELLILGSFACDYVLDHLTAKRHVRLPAEIREELEDFRDYIITELG